MSLDTSTCTFPVSTFDPSQFVLTEYQRQTLRRAIATRQKVKMEFFSCPTGIVIIGFSIVPEVRS